MSQAELRPAPKVLHKRNKKAEKRKDEEARRVLIHYLTQHRARRLCEFCLSEPDFLGLMGHHIIKLSQGGEDTARNILIGCSSCHNHTKYGTGTPLTVEEQQTLVNALNKKYGINGGLTGYDLLGRAGTGDL